MTVAAVVVSGATTFDTTSADSYATSSWDGADGTQLYVAGWTVAGTELRTMTVSGNGLTWTNNVTTVDWDSIAAPARRMGFATAVGTPTTGATTVDGGAGTNFVGGCLIVVEITGADTAVTNGIVQSASGVADSGTAESVTLAAFGSATNAVLGFFGQDVATAPTAGTGSIPTNGSGTHLTPGTGFMAEFLASEDTSVTATGENNAWAGIAMEIKELVANTLAWKVGLIHV